MKNKYWRIKNTVFIQTKRKNGETHNAMIDASDLKIAYGYKHWRYMKGAEGRSYIVASTWEDNLKIVLLHRLIMDTPEHSETKFLNNDTLDCRRCNLVVTDHMGVCTRITPKKTVPHSGDANITKVGRLFAVQIRNKGKRYYKGFRTRLAAIAHRDELRRMFAAEIKGLKPPKKNKDACQP